MSAVHRATVATFILSYLLTTVFGAALLVTDFGASELNALLPGFLTDPPEQIGSWFYWWTLLVPLAVVPVVSLVALPLARSLVAVIRLGPAISETRVHTPALFAMLALAGGWCVWALLSSGHSLWPQSFGNAGDYIANITQRAALIEDLGFVFYACLYAALPTICVLFISKWNAERTNPADLVGFVLCFAIIVHLSLVVAMKASLLVFFVFLGVSLIVGGIRARFVVPAMLVLGFVTMVGLQAVIGGLTTERSPAPEKVVDLPAAELAADHPIWAMARAATFRMAAPVPYYVALFTDPASRCGMDRSGIPFLPQPRCAPQKEVFKAMYPQITWTEGDAPTAAHISALGEYGPLWSVAVMLLSGALLALMVAIAETASRILRPVIVAICCAFAYYLTQVPLVGALAYAHGLLPYALPVALLVLPVWMRRGVMKPVLAALALAWIALYLIAAYNQPPHLCINHYLEVTYGYCDLAASLSSMPAHTPPSVR